MKILLIDGNHLCGRHHAVLKDLRRSDGHLSGVVHGVLNGISYVKNLLQIEFNEMVMTWDGGRCKKRLDIYPEYKAGRKWDRPEQTEEEIFERNCYINEMNALKEGLSFLGIRQVRVPGVEADDLLGILSTFYSDLGYTSVVYSGDSDLHQCVSSSVWIYDPKKEIMTQEDIEAKYKLRADQLPKFKALTGDQTDNISGIGGVGEVRAKIILRYLDSTIPDSKRVEAKDRKWIELLAENWSIYQRNLKLVTIPRSWETDLYDESHQEATLEQLLDLPKQRSKEFLDFLRTWELAFALENVRRWL